MGKVIFTCKDAIIRCIHMKELTEAKTSIVEKTLFIRKIVKFTHSLYIFKMDHHDRV